MLTTIGRAVTTGSFLTFSVVAHLLVLAILFSAIDIGSRRRIIEVTLMPGPHQITQAKNVSPERKPIFRKPISRAEGVVQQKTATADTASGAAPAPTVDESARAGQNTAAKSLEGVRSYRAELRREIEMHKDYPAAARARHQQGKVEVRFTVLRDGTLRDIRCQTPSLYSSLNESAMSSVIKVGKFKPLPEEINSKTLDLIVPIDFVLN